MTSRRIQSITRAATITGIAGHNVGMNFGGTLFKLYFTAIGPGTAFLSIPASSVSLWDAAET